MIMRMNRILTVAALASAMLACSAVKPTSSTTGQAVASDASTLLGSNWQLDGADRGVLATSPEAQKITLGFFGDRVAGHAGCNRWFSNYRFEGDRLILEQAATTMMLCQGAANEVERAFLELLAKPLTVHAHEGHLQVEAADGTVLRFLPFKTPPTESP